MWGIPAAEQSRLEQMKARLNVRPPEDKVRQDTEAEIKNLEGYILSNNVPAPVIDAKLDALDRVTEAMNKAKFKAKNEEHEAHLELSSSDNGKVDVHIKDGGWFGKDTIIRWVPKTVNISVFLTRLADIYNTSPGIIPGKEASYDDIVKSNPQIVDRTQVDTTKDTQQLKGLAKAIEDLSNDPNALKKAVDLYNTEKEKYNPEARREAVRAILVFCVFPKGMQLDLTGGRIAVSDANGAIRSDIADILNGMPRENLVDALNLHVGKDYRAAGLDSKKLYEAMNREKNLGLTGVVSNDLMIISAATNLSAAEKSWLKNYVTDHDSVSLSSEKQQEFAPQVERMAQTQEQGRKAVEKYVPMTAADWESPGKALSKIISNGGATLLVGGGLWLIFSCFGFDTTGEKGSFFMKILALIGGAGLAKGVGLWNAGYDAINGTPGSAGAAAVDAVSEFAKNAMNWTKRQFGDVAGWSESGIEIAKIMYKFRDWTFQDGTDQKKLQDCTAGKLFQTVNTDPMWASTIGPRKDSRPTTMDADTKQEFHDTVTKVYNEAFNRWKTDNPAHPTDADFMAFVQSSGMTLGGLLTWTYKSVRTAPALATWPSLRDRVLTVATAKYQDNWFSGASGPIPKAGLLMMLGSAANDAEVQSKLSSLNVIATGASNAAAVSLLQELKNTR